MAGWLNQCGNRTENNLSETVFFVPAADKKILQRSRWFTCFRDQPLRSCYGNCLCAVQHNGLCETEYSFQQQKRFAAVHKRWSYRDGLSFWKPGPDHNTRKNWLPWFKQPGDRWRLPLPRSALNWTAKKPVKIANRFYPHEKARE